jgi:hypothetical protein
LIRSLRWLTVAALLASVGAIAAEYRVLGPADGAQSAKAVAEKLREHLAAGNLEEAALLSTAPKRRFEVLRDYRDAVGDSEFRRVFGDYPRSPVAEVAMGERRLLVWKLAQGIAGQYYVRIDGRFLLDDVPNAERNELKRLLEAYRAGKLSF